MVADHQANGASPSNTKIRIQIYGMSKYFNSIEIDTSLIHTIGDLKNHLLQTCNDPSINDLNIIKKGSILNELDTLEQCNITDNCKIYAISNNNNPRSSINKSQPNQNSFKTTSQPMVDTPQSPIPQNSSSLSNSMNNTQQNQSTQDILSNALSGQMSPNSSIGTLSQQMMNDPKFLQDVMKNPSIQKMMSNPELISSIMKNPNLMQSISDPDALQKLMNDPSNNPIMQHPDLVKDLMKDTDIINTMFNNNEHFKKIFDKNPHLKQALSNPDVLSDMMESYSSKAASDQMNYMNDIALSQIENMGAFNQVESMYNSLSDALDSMQTDLNSNPNLDEPLPTSSSVADNSTSQSALPNPWNTSSTNGQSKNPKSYEKKKTNFSKNSNNSFANGHDTEQNLLSKNQVAFSPLQSLLNKPITSQHLEHLIATNPRYMMQVSRVVEAVQNLYNSNPHLCQEYFLPLANDSLFNELLKHINIVSTTKHESNENIERVMVTDRNFMMNISRFVICLNDLLKFDPIFFHHYFKFHSVANKSLVSQMGTKMITSFRQKLKNRTIQNKVQVNQAKHHNKDTSSSSNVNHNVFELQLRALSEMGFNRSESFVALQRTNGNIDHALNLLLASGAAVSNSNTNPTDSNPHNPNHNNKDDINKTDKSDKNK